MEMNVVGRSEVVRAVLRCAVTTAARGISGPLVSRATGALLIGKRLRSSLNRSGKRIENRTERGDVVHSSARAKHSAVAVKRTVSQPEARHESEFVGGSQRVRQTGLARRENRGAWRTVNCRSLCRAKVRAGIEIGQKARIQQGGLSIRIDYAARERHGRIEVTDVSSGILIAWMKFITQTIGQREFWGNLKSVLTVEIVINRSAVVILGNRIVEGS